MRGVWSSRKRLRSWRHRSRDKTATNQLTRDPLGILLAGILKLLFGHRLLVGNQCQDLEGIYLALGGSR